MAPSDLDFFVEKIPLKIPLTFQNLTKKNSYEIIKNAIRWSNLKHYKNTWSTSPRVFLCPCDLDTQAIVFCRFYRSTYGLAIPQKAKRASVGDNLLGLWNR